METVLIISGIAAALFLIILLFQIRLDIPVEKLKEKYCDEASQFVKILGAEVHYKDEGKGYPLVLLHGANSSLHTWDRWSELLSPYYRLIRVDIPGFGITGPTTLDEYSVDNAVVFLQKFFNHLGIDSCYLCGNSLGGWISWEFAIKHPEMVKKLVLIDAAGFIDLKRIPLPFKMARNPVSRRFMTYFAPKMLFRLMVNQAYKLRDEVPDDVVDRYFDLYLRQGNRRAFAILANSSSHSNVDRLHELKMPTLILWGAEDIWIRPEDGARFHFKIEDSYLIIYPHVGHVPMEEVPVKSAEDLRRFLEGMEMIER